MTFKPGQRVQTQTRRFPQVTIIGQPRGLKSWWMIRTDGKHEFLMPESQLTPT